MEFYNAAKQGNLNALKVLYTDYVHQYAIDGMDAYLAAARRGHVHILKWLDEKGWCKTFGDWVPGGAYEIAIRFGKLEILKYLDSINYGHSFLTTEEMEYAPDALYYDKDKTINVYDGLTVKYYDYMHIAENIEYCYLDCNPYLLAVLSGDLEIVKYLISINIDDTNHCNTFGENDYLIAVRYGFLSTLKYIDSIDSRRRYKKDINGFDAYLIAVKYGHRKIIKYLQETNFEPSLCNHGLDAYLVACYYSKLIELEDIIPNNDHISYDGYDALMITVFNDSFSTGRYLLDTLNWPRNRTSNKGYDAYLLAAQMGKTFMLEVLDYHKWEHKLDNDGNDAYLIAIMNGNISTLWYLEKNKMITNHRIHRNCVGRDDFLTAARYKTIPIYMYCIKRTPNLSICDNYGFNAYLTSIYYII